MAKRAKIILIDDDQSTRFYVKHKLQAQYEFESFESWSQAWKNLGECDLILLDVQLKGLKGNDISKLIKDKFEKERVTEPPIVIFFSCLEEKKLAQLQKDCNVDGFLVKDFSVGDLCEKIEALLARRKPRRTQAKTAVRAAHVSTMSSPRTALEDESTEGLLKILDEGNFLKRAGAIFILGQRQPLNARVEEALKRCLDDDKSVVRNAAKVALSRSAK